MKTFFSKNGLKFGIIVLLLMVSFSLIGCGGSSSTSTPEPVGVTFYKDAEYKNTSVTYGVGKYDETKLDQVGLKREISSIKIPKGFKVTIYSGGYFAGQQETFIADVINLKDIGPFNDWVSSVEVEAN